MEEYVNSNVCYTFSPPHPPSIPLLVSMKSNITYYILFLQCSAGVKIRVKLVAKSESKNPRKLFSHFPLWNFFLYSRDENRSLLSIENICFV